MGGVVKSVTKPFKQIGKAVSKGVSSVFKAAGKVGNAAVKTVSSAGKAVSKGVRSVWNGVETVGKNLLGKQETPSVDIQAPAAAAPPPEQATEDLSRPENVGRKKKSRSSLRIDLNTGGAPSGNGVNVPVG